MYDLNTAMQLASLLLIFVSFFLFIERIERRKLSYSYASSTFKKINKQQLKGFKNLLAFFFCFTPLFVGFLMPIMEISNWAINYTSENFFSDIFLKSFFNTIILGIMAGIICTLFAFLFNFLKRFETGNYLKGISFILSMGYAIPGLVLAVGIIQLFSLLDNNFLRSYFDLILTGSIVGLLLAYIIKSYALANNSIESGYERINDAIDDVSLSLKVSKLKIFFQVHMPLLKTSILTSLVLVISEVIKELPATLILRPFNFDTLAVTTYIYAAEERMFEAATPAIMIVLIGLVPIFFLSKIIRESRPGKT
jgi:iron(III) transport system permease protein